MRQRFLSVVVCLLALFTLQCGGSSSPTAPSAPTPTPQTPTLVSLTGTVTSATGARLAGVNLVAQGGPNNGRTASTTSNGEYRFDNLQPGNLNVQASGADHEQLQRSVNVNGTNTLNFTLLPNQRWSHSGAGNTVFNMPTYIQRVRIRGTWNRTSTSNFIVHIGGRNVLNEILRESITYDGLHLTNGGVVEIISSGQIAWSFVEER